MYKGQGYTIVCDILNENVKVEEIEYVVRKLKNGKSPGIDHIPVEFIKESIDIIKHDLQHIFNYVLSYEKYPDEWCHCLEVSSPKGSNGIRPITIEPIFPKIFETILDIEFHLLTKYF